VLALYRDLLRLRRALPLLRPGAVEPTVAHDEREGWVVMRRTGDDQVLDALFNFATEPRGIPDGSGGAEVLLSSDDPRYGGDGGVRLSAAAVTLPARTGVLLRSRR
jgi:hypothetical protein